MEIEIEMNVESFYFSFKGHVESSEIMEVFLNDVCLAVLLANVYVMEFEYCVHVHV